MMTLPMMAEGSLQQRGAQSDVAPECQTSGSGDLQVGNQEKQDLGTTTETMATGDNGQQGATTKTVVYNNVIFVVTVPYNAHDGIPKRPLGHGGFVDRPVKPSSYRPHDWSSTDDIMTMIESILMSSASRMSTNSAGDADSGNDNSGESWSSQLVLPGMGQSTNYGFGDRWEARPQSRYDNISIDQYTIKPECKPNGYGGRSPRPIGPGSPSGKSFNPGNSYQSTSSILQGEESNSSIGSNNAAGPAPQMDVQDVTDMIGQVLDGDGGSIEDVTGMITLLLDSK